MVNAAAVAVAPRARGRPAAARRARRADLAPRPDRPGRAARGRGRAASSRWAPTSSTGSTAPPPAGPRPPRSPGRWPPCLGDDEQRRAANPAVLGGDLNAVPWSDEVRGLTGSAGPHVPGLVFVDAWEAAGNEGRGDTWAAANPRVPRRAVHPNRRLDYVMVSWPRRRGVGPRGGRAVWPAPPPSTGSGPATTTPWWPTSTSEPRRNPGAVPGAQCDDRPMADRYTHGHHESVLRSHRWRTAENSAGVPAPPPAPRASGCSTSAAGRAPSPSTWPRRVAPGAVVGIDASADVIAAAVAARDEAELDASSVTPGGGRRLRPRRPTTPLRRGPRPPGAPAPHRPGGRAAGDAAGARARAAWSPSARATTAPSPGPPTTRCSTAGWRSTTRSPGPTAPTPTPAATCPAGSAPPGSPTSRSAAPPGPSPSPTTGRGGVGCGPTGSWPAPSPTRPSSTAWPTGPSSTTSPPPSGAGPLADDAVFVVRPRRGAGPGLSGRPARATLGG